MSWKNIGNLIKQGAPLVANVVTGGAGGPVASMVAGLFGADENDPTDIEHKILADPDAMVKLKKFEMDNKVDLEKIALQLFQAENADRESARERSAAYTKDTGKVDWNVTGIAWLVTIGFLAATGTLMFVSLPVTTNAVVMMLFGTLSTAFGTVLAYFFGSSKSSSDKTKLLTNNK
jgi:hypothetical protein